jgi:hypothetical protein
LVKRNNSPEKISLIWQLMKDEPPLHSSFLVILGKLGGPIARAFTNHPFLNISQLVMYTPFQLYPFRGHNLAVLSGPSPLQSAYRTLSPAEYGPLAQGLLASDDCASRFQTLSWFKNIYKSINENDFRERTGVVCICGRGEKSFLLLRNI